MKFKGLIFGLFLLANNPVHAQKIALSKDDKVICALTLKERLGTGSSYNPIFVLDSSQINNFEVDISEKLKVGEIWKYVEEYEWSYIYSQTNKSYTFKTIKIPAEKLVNKINFYPNFSIRGEVVTLSPILYNEDKNKGLVSITTNTYRSTVYMFFQRVKGKWALVHKDGIYLID